MFIFGIFGIQDRIKQIKEFSNIICVCGRYTRMQLAERYTYFHIFFIPVIKWNRKYFVEARCCGRVFEVPEDYKDEIMKADVPDLSRLKEMEAPYIICPECAHKVDSNYMYCPYCGRKIK